MVTHADKRKRDRRPVICIETGEDFPDIEAAARRAGCKPNAIKDHLSGKTVAAAGYHWAWSDLPAESWHVPVICRETGIEFLSPAEAATWAGCEAREVADCLIGKTPSGGGHSWDIPPKKLRAGNRPVACIEHGTRFANVREAAARFGCPSAIIAGAAKGVAATARGVHWAFADRPESTWRVPVVCLDTGEGFENLGAAAERTGCDADEIADCISGKKSAAGGVRWNIRGVKPPRRGKRVICVEIGKEFPSAVQAASWAGCCAGSVLLSAAATQRGRTGRRKTSAAGYHWAWADQPPASWRIPVRCIDEDASFEGLGEAAKWAGCEAAEIADCLAGRATKAGGRHWATAREPRGRQKPVVCVETGERFPSVRAAAKRAGCGESAISHLLGHRASSAHTAAGLHWARADEPASQWLIPVACQDTGNRFESLGAAAEWAGCKAEEIAACLAGAAEDAGGHRWTIPESKPGGRRKPVTCLETGQTFPSIKEAATWAETSPAPIWSALVGNTATAGGFHWGRADEPASRWPVPIACRDTGNRFESLGDAAEWAGCEATEIAECLAGRVEKAGEHRWAFQTKTLARPVTCIDTGETFPSVAAAARWAKIGESCIFHVLAGRTKTAGGYRWTYADEPAGSRRDPNGPIG